MDTEQTRAHQAFYNGTRGPNTSLVINDYVEVIGGLSTGLKGTVISREQVEPEPIYRIERDDGNGFHVESSQNLRLVEPGLFPLPLRACRTLVSFEQAARKFVQLASGSTVKGAQYPDELHRAILELAKSISRLVLSDLSPPLGDEDIDDLGLDVDTKEWKAVFDSTNTAIGNTYYDFIWSDGDKTIGCIADDVADIYRDLKPGLDAWDMHQDEYLADIIWTWKLSYTGHWKWHLDGLLGALPAIVPTND